MSDALPNAMPPLSGGLTDFVAPAANTFAPSLFGGHEIVLPVVLPLIAGALILLLETARSRWVSGLSMVATLALVALAALLAWQADVGVVQTYLVGNWAAPWGIALALDRLSALLVLLTAVVATTALAYARGADSPSARTGHFHSLLQFQLMGLNGAFLTADLFNLFVFFEVLLAASYGLLLHLPTRERLKASVHYVVFNLAGSALFLVGLGLLFGAAGTLNMADLSAKLPTLPPPAAALAQAGVLLLWVVFALKAALLPINFWLPGTYAAASAPAAAVFALLTKVGVYAILRTAALGLVVPGTWATEGLTALALATLAAAAVAALAARSLRELVACLVLASAGTLLVAVGLGSAAAVAAGLLYLVNSTLAAAAWFLLADRISLQRAGSDRLESRPLAAGWVPLGGAFFVAALAATGAPPLAGFLGKAMLLQAAWDLAQAGWVWAVVLGSSLATLVALARAGSVLFWGPAPSSGPDLGPAPAPALSTLRVRPARGAGAWPGAAIAALLAALVTIAAAAGPIARYCEAAAQQLHAREPFVRAVLDARPVPPLFAPRQGAHPARERTP